jgi:hypothetical protein
MGLIGTLCLYLAVPGTSTTGPTASAGSATGFSWATVIPWALSFLQFVFIIYQWLRTRRWIVRVRTEIQRDRHVRYFCVHFTNCGADLYDVCVQIECTQAGTNHPHALTPLGGLPNPFKLLQSRRFTLMNDDPGQSLALESLPSGDVAIVVYSGITPVKRICGKKLKRHLDEFSKPDPTMPPKPQDAPRDERNWVYKYKGKW